MKRAVFPGSFDPITNGHHEIITRGAQLFDEVVVAIGVNADKKYMFTLEERIAFIESAFAKFTNIRVTTYEGLTVDLCKKIDAKYILRGLRNIVDFEYEKTIAHANEQLHDVENVFLITNPETSFVSSTVVRDILRNGGDASNFVPASVIFKK